MKAWSEGLDQKFDQMTSGSNDVTGAYQLQQVISIVKFKVIANLTFNNESKLDDKRFSLLFIFQVYQQKFNGQILQTDGKQIAKDMKAKMESIFDKNINALRVNKKYISQIPSINKKYYEKLKHFLSENNILFCNSGFTSQG